eukprot:5620168-Pleurochrysis_carterae.AAC.2
MDAIRTAYRVSVHRQPLPVDAYGPDAACQYNGALNRSAYLTIGESMSNNFKDILCSCTYSSTQGSRASLGKAGHETILMPHSTFSSCSDAFPFLRFHRQLSFSQHHVA